MKQTCFVRCFLKQERVFLRIKHLTEKTTKVALLTHFQVMVYRGIPNGKDQTFVYNVGLEFSFHSEVFLVATHGE